MSQNRHPDKFAFVRRLGGLGAVAVIALAVSAAQAGDAAPAGAPPASVDFVRDIQPIFQSACYKCHDGAKHKGGLRLDSKMTAFVGGDSGDRSIIPADPEHSKILPLIRGDDPKSVMPPKGDRLSAVQIDLLTRWIKQGAVWPDGIDKASASLTHWSFSKPARPPLPDVKQKDWCRNPIDHFVLSRLEQEGLKPVAEADRNTLCRRLYLDLIGLPPTPAELDAFLNDQSPDAYEKLVDALQANPHYGERWARVWLDCARYADSAGYGSDPLRKTCFRYRDWVIGAFNRNLPYDQFTVEQIAGDMLASPTTDQLIATGFNRNTMTNTEGGTDAEEFRVAAVKDRVETSVQVWMGLTVGCAQCHTHKYDPITNREYYQLYAIFNQSEDANRGDESPTIPTPSAEDESKIQQIKAKIDAANKKLNDRAEWTAAISDWEKSLGAKPTQWTVLEPSTMTAASGTTLEKRPDGSIKAAGPQPASDHYTITARTDLKRVTAFRVEVLGGENAPTKENRAAAFALTGFHVAVAANKSAPPIGQYVRIELPGKKKYLNLAEVQVFHDEQNIALAGKAKQSSTDFGGNAAYAIDGITDGDYAKHPTSHTAESDNPWWEVDLGKPQSLDRLVLWNRTDGGFYTRLTNLHVQVLNDKHAVVWETETGTAFPVSLEISLTAGRAISLKDASDSFHQGDFSAATVLEAGGSDKSGWSVYPEIDKPHAAVFQTTQALSGPIELNFSLSQQTATGAIRISATADPQPVRVLPDDLAKVLAVAPELRTEEQNARLFDHFKAIAPQMLAQRAELVRLQKEVEMVKPSVTAIMRELPPARHRENRLLIKGNFLVKGPPVEPAVLAAFNPLPKNASADRMGLARWFIDQDNPLTARVAVNRFWAALFGIGIVETQEDFGTQGQLPSNQPLLDWMAVEFRDPSTGATPRTAWDMKRLVRMIVTSAAYRQSSRVTPEILQKDPRNRLISRGPRRRLEAELVRDQALALSGLLSPRMFGPSVFPPQPDGLWQAAFNGERTWPASVGEDKYRRGLYVFWRRTVPYPSMSAFDAPSREVCTLRRVPTSTPLQAFVTMNDPVYVECSQALARRIVKEGGATPQARAAFALQLCLCRPPEPAQVERIVSLYNSELEHYGASPAEAKKLATEPIGPLPRGMTDEELAAWTVCSNVLLNLDGVLTNH